MIFRKLATSTWSVSDVCRGSNASQVQLSRTASGWRPVVRLL